MSKKKSTKKASTAKAATKSDPDLVPLSMLDKAKKGGKAPAAKTPKKLSCLDAAARVLQSNGKAMTTKDMVNAMFSAKLWHSDAPTPAATLYSAILREIQKKGKDARFKKTDRGLFAHVG